MGFVILKKESERMKKMYMLLAVVLFMAITGCGSGGGDAAPPALSSEKAITAFNFASPAATGTVTESTHTIAVTVPFAPDVTALIPTITISAGASISPDTGVANNFTTPRTYTVTAADSTTQDYVVTVTVSGDYTSANIGTLKYVPAGSFQRDATTENISTITTAFRMSQYEITQAQYVAVTTATNPSWFSGDTLPVEQVTWYDAIEFCNDLSISTLEGLTPVYTITSRIPSDGSHPITSATVTANWAANGYRLPTEMEWMWAAMGATSDSSNGYTGTGTNTTGYTKGYAGSTEAGGTQANIGNYAWTSGNAGLTTHQVGTAGTTGHPNELGLYDISGNVWEWVWDWNDDYPNGALASNTAAGRGAASGTNRVLRGGCWDSVASRAAVANRGYYYPNVEYNGIGFRVVRP